MAADAENISRGLDFLRGGGELGKLIREKDWSRTPFGPPEGWPQSLRSAVSIMLNSRYPIALYWGPELALLYNDSWSSIPGGKHPWALGRPGKEVWPEIWDQIGPLYERVMTTGEGIWQEDELLPMHRHGYLEECYYNFTFSPVTGERGSIDGIFNAVVETTEQVLSARRLRTLSRMGERTDPALSVEDACKCVAGNLIQNQADAPFALIYLKADGHARLVASEGVRFGSPAAPATISLSNEDESPWALSKAANAGSALIVEPPAGLELPAKVWPEPIAEVIILPIVVTGETDASAFLVAGVNPRRRMDASYQSFFELAAGHVGTAIGAARAYERERQRSEALAEIDRAKTAFFSNVSHEFRTPLTLMLGPLEEVLQKPEGGVTPDNRDLVDVAHRNGLRLLRLVNALLDFSRIEEGRAQATYRPTDLAAYTAELASSFQALIKKGGLRLTVDTPKLPQDVYVDHDMWEKIVLNLLSNAFKFTLEGEIAVLLSATPAGAALTVRDTGIGIAQSELPKLFERFHRVESAKGRSFEGSGIGLALVHELVKLHGGEVRIESEVGTGSTFQVIIPFGRDHLPAERVSEDPRPPAASAAAPFVEEALRWLPDRSTVDVGAGKDRQSVSSKRPRIVLADDNSDMRNYVLRLLADDYDVDAVTDGVAALEAIRRERPTLVLTDIMMPKLDGFGLLKAIREDEALSDIPVIVLSARAGEEAQIGGLEAGADDYLVKPFSARELIARVRSNIELAQARYQAEDALKLLNRKLSDETRRLNDMFEQSPSFMAILRGPDHVFELANPAYRRLVGERELIGKSLRDAFPDLKGQGFYDLVDEVYRTGEPHVGLGTEVLIRHRPDGPVEPVHVDFAYQPMRDETGEVNGILVQGSDVTERVRAEKLQLTQNRVLELALDDKPMRDTLDALVLTVEKQSATSVLGSILLLDPDGKHLRHGAAPNLPDAYNAAIDGVAIGPSVGSCGTAAFTGEPVYVSDIATDPLWKDFRELALTHGLKACWSIPILSSSRQVLGTFAMYHREPRAPTPEELQLVGFVTRSAALIIERKQSEEALRTSESRFRAVFENAGVGLLLIDGDWNILQVNQRYCDIVGRADSELVGTSCLGFTHEEDLVRSADAMRSLQDTPNGQISFEKRYIGKDGRTIWVRSNLARVSGEDGEERFLKIIEDVTKRRAAEAALEEERRTLETLNRTGSAIAAELGLERVVEMVTDAGVELTGAQFGAFFYNVVDPNGERYMLYALSGVDRSHFDKFPMPRNTKVFAPTFAGEGVVRSDDITKDPRYGKNPPYYGKPKGHLPVVSYLAVPVVGRNDEAIGGLFFGHAEPNRFTERHETLMKGIAAQAAVAIDNARLYRDAEHEIEQRVKAERALTALNETLESRVTEEIERRLTVEEALRQAQKMETVGQLSGGIAHDFNNLLQVIHGNLSILDRAIPESEQKLRRSVANALAGAERAAALTKRLLAFSRRQPLDAQPVDINRLIVDMTELVQRTLGETITIQTQLSDAVPNALVDGNQLENAILNLAINARDAMPGGGRLEICTALVTLDSEDARRDPESAPGRYVCIEVRDNGEGMSEDVLSRAIEPFFSTKEVGQGTGLGLSMVYGFVRQSGGFMKLRSLVGEGTSIDLYIPATDVAVDHQPAEDEGRDLPQGRGERILLCEDDDDVRFFSGEALRDLGYEVFESSDAASALAALESDGPFALLFTDVVLPGGKTGADLAREARAIQPGLKVLFTTGYARSALDRENFGGRAIEVLSKPFGVDKLATKLREMLG